MIANCLRTHSVPVPLSLCSTTSGTRTKSGASVSTGRHFCVLEAVRSDVHLLCSSRDSWPLVLRPNGGPAIFLGPWPFPFSFLWLSLQLMEYGNVASDVLAPGMRLPLSAQCITSNRVVSHCVHQWSNR